MVHPITQESLEKSRLDIADVVRDLRKARRWTQAELAKQLELSQNRLSEIERGDGSFTAEQFLRILRLFNVEVSEFAREDRDHSLEVQNALARLGATELHESTSVLPSEHLADVHDVIREALILGEPRLITAIAPVLVAHARRLNVSKIYADSENLGYGRRLVWVIENTRVALGTLARNRPNGWSKIQRRVEVPLLTYVELLKVRLEEIQQPPLDALDPTIRSRRTFEEVRRRSSEISKRWGIVTSLQPEDFVEALKASHVAGRGILHRYR